MPVGQRSTASSNGHARPVHQTSSTSGPRARPGCTRYQWPNSMASLTAPRNKAPTSVRATDNRAGSPASIPAASSATSPTTGATRSRMGGNSGTSGSNLRAFSRTSTSMPVISATRVLRCSSTTLWPATPARRRRTDTTKATTVATTTPAVATSLTGTVLNMRPTTSEPTAIRPKVIRMVQP